MSDLMSIGSSAVKVYQRALGTVANNIANLDTDGYTRRLSSVEELQPKMEANAALGTGSLFAGVERAYDSFIENSVRDAASELGEKSKLLTYTNRLLNLVGKDEVGLSSAMDQFFTSTNAVAADPGSLIYRQELIADGQSLAQRFVDLSAQIESLDRESTEDLESLIEGLNVRLDQLAVVNKELQKKTELSKQSPDLLDQRDLLLREISELIPVKVTFDNRGVVKVSGSTSMTAGILVDGRDAFTVGLREMSDGVRELVIDPFKRAEPLPNVAFGEIGGVLTFQKSVLSGTLDQLDQMALLFADHTNAVHKAGVDLYGDLGTALFEISPTFEIDTRSTSSPIEIRVDVTDPEQFSGNAMRMDYLSDGETGRWTLTNTQTGASYAETSPGVLQGEGLTVTVTGDARSPDSVGLIPSTRPAAGIEFLTEDPKRIAAAGLFRVTEHVSNLTDAMAYLSFVPDRLIDSDLNNLVNQTQRVVPIEKTSAELSRNAPLGFIAAGSEDVVLSNRVDPENPVTLQVFTREGRHLLGAPLEETDQLFTESNGFISGATYTDEYLNQTGTDAYKDMDYFYGTRAAVKDITYLNYVTTGKTDKTEIASPTEYAATITSDRLPPFTGANGGTVITAGALSVQGISLGALTLESHGRLDAATVSQWINAALNDPGVAESYVAARAEDAIWIERSDLDLSKDLTINGIEIDFKTGATKFASVDELVEQINAAFDAAVPGPFLPGTGAVHASVNQQGAVVLRNLEAARGRNIHVDATTPNAANALGLSTGYHTGRLVLEQQPPAVFDLDDIDDIDLTNADGLGLTINGQVISFPDDGNGFDDLQALSDRINQVFQELDPDVDVTSVVSSINGRGQLVLRNADPRDASEIRLGSETRALKFDAANIDLNNSDRNGLRINGDLITFPAGGFADLQALADEITASIAGITATVNGNNQLVLNHTLASDSQIVVEGPAGAIHSVLGTAQLIGGALDEDFSLDVEITELGSSQDLGRIGLRAEAYIDGLIDEDLIVIATSNGTDPQGSEFGFGAYVESNSEFVLQSSLRDSHFELDIVQGPSLGQTELQSFAYTHIEGGDQLSIQVTGDPAQTITYDVAGVGFDIDPASSIPFADAIDGLVAAFNASDASWRLGADDEPLTAYREGRAIVFEAATQTRDAFEITSVSGTTRVTAEGLANGSVDGPLRRGEIPSEYGVFEITDTDTGTVVAERQWPSDNEITYRGVTMRLTEQPAEGDTFTVDGNNLGPDGDFDGQGNNENIKQLAALETDRSVSAGGQTFSEQYVDVIATLGNQATQTDIAKTAIKAVYDQALVARDEVSGVSLDREAADLVRFQQAYQASAQIMQTATRLFDTIIAIR